jgi:hypothetical protein
MQKSRIGGQGKLKTFSFDSLSDLPDPKELIQAGLFNGSRSAIYNLFNRPDFPKIRIGKKMFVTKENLKKWLEEQTGA